MSEWKKRFAPTLFIRELVSLGPFRIEEEPKTLPEGKFSARITLKKGGVKLLSTYEGTIGNIMEAQGQDGWCIAYESKEVSKKTGEPFVNFRNAKA